MWGIGERMGNMRTWDQWVVTSLGVESLAKANSGFSCATWQDTGALGYADSTGAGSKGMPNSLAVEFDAYQDR